jgi:hypothetical protein
MVKNVPRPKCGKISVWSQDPRYRYISTGHIVYYLTNNNIVNAFAVPFDLNRLDVTGGPISVLEGIGNATFSDSGTLLYVPQRPASPETV